MKSRSVLAILAFLLASCSNPYADHWQQVAQEQRASQDRAKALADFHVADLPQFPYELVAWPDASIPKRILTMISRAKSHVELNVYLLTRQDVTAALVAAKGRGVRVRAILEKTPYQTPKANTKAYDALTTAGISVAWADEKRFNFDHAKYLVADDAVMISTGNMTATSLSKNREFFLFSSDSELRSDLLKIFDADFADMPMGESFDRLYISPTDARPKIEKVLREATGSIYLYAESLSDEKTVSILGEKRKAGLDVKICLGEAPDGRTSRALRDENIPFTQASKPYVHAKSLLVDGRYLAIGSLNFTSNSFDNNREVGVFLKDSPFASRYLSIFHKDCTYP